MELHVSFDVPCTAASTDSLPHCIVSQNLQQPMQPTAEDRQASGKLLFRDQTRVSNDLNLLCNSAHTCNSIKTVNSQLWQILVSTDTTIYGFVKLAYFWKVKS